MKSSRTSKIVSFVMLVGALPCTAATVLFLHLMAARLAGRPASGDGLGLMMMSFAAYAIALLTCVIGLVYFTYARVKLKELPRAWDWLGIGYSIGQVTIPIIYFQ